MSDIEPAEEARTLREVQSFDTRIFDLKRQIEALEEKHGLGELRQELDSARQEQAELEAELSDLEHRQHKLDGELDLLVGKMEKEEARMMSGTIMNPKELSAIQSEIFSLRKKRDEMETEDLEEMEAIDSLQTRIKRAKERVSGVTGRLAEATAAYEAELASEQEQVSSLEARRDELKAALDSGTVEAYEKLLAEKDGLAVVDIIQGRICGGCRIEFSRTQIDRIHHGEGVFRCEYCRRMLVK